MIDQQLKKKLLELYIFKQTSSLSGIIIKILRLMYPRLENEHYSCVDRENRYQHVNGDKSIPRCHVHVYLPQEFYRRLKLMHHDLNMYSMAQLLRWIIRCFLKLLSIHGIKLKEKLKPLLGLWQKQKTIISLPQKVMRQLSILFNHQQGNLKLLNLYKTDFSPLVVYPLL